MTLDGDLAIAQTLKANVPPRQASVSSNLTSTSSAPRSSTSIPLRLESTNSEPSVSSLSPRRLSETRLASFNIVSSPTARDLYDLWIELDHQCLLHTVRTADRDIGALSDVNTIVRVAIELSSPHRSDAVNQDSFMFREMQLRALAASLALLHYHKVESLYPQQWDTLNRTNISILFKSIAYQKRPRLEDHVRYASNMYLVQLSILYGSFLRRGESNLPEVVGPIVRVFFGSVSVVSGQYGNSEEILKGLTQLAGLWHKPQTKYQSLCGLQECVRLVLGICREFNCSVMPLALEKATILRIKGLLEKATEFLDAELRQGLPTLTGQWPRVRALVNIAPANLDRGYYVYGLLDCISQLAALVRFTMLPTRLVEWLKKVIFEEGVPQYQWKSIEILLSSHQSRKDRIEDIVAPMRQRIHQEDLADVTRAVALVDQLLHEDERADLRFRINKPLTDESENLDHEGRNQERQTCSERNINETSWREHSLPRSREPTSTSFQVPFPKEKAWGLGRTNYDFAGLSSDCENAFFYSEYRICVFRLGSLKTDALCSKTHRAPRFFDKDTRPEPIESAAMGQTLLSIVTKKHTYVINALDGTRFRPLEHGKWDPSGLTCYQTPKVLVVFLGTQGQIRVYIYLIGTLPEELSRHHTIITPFQCSPKRIHFDPQTRLLTCVTRSTNKILVWRLDKDLSDSTLIFDYTKDHHPRESLETGITSTSIYVSPSTRPYLLSTTAPSSERVRNNGEYSFILPLPPSPNPPYHRPPNHTIHNLEQFRKHTALRAGCVSSRHHVLAVLEQTGRISLLPLDAHESGGVGGAERVRFVDEKLAKQEQPLGSCLRFDEDGNRLIAVDPKGRVIVVDFHGADSAPEMQERRCEELAELA